MHDQRDKHHLARSQSLPLSLSLSQCALNRTRIGGGTPYNRQTTGGFVPSMTLCRSNPQHRGWDEANHFGQTSPSDDKYTILSSVISFAEVVKHVGADI